jgi:hypothetical protein
VVPLGILLRSQVFGASRGMHPTEQVLFPVRFGPFRNHFLRKTRVCYYQRNGTHPGGASGLPMKH